MRVLFPEQFNLSEFPKLENLAAMMDEFEKRAVRPFVGKQVYGGFRHGSNTTGGATIMSDSDYFLVVNNERHNEVVHRVIKEIYAKTFVFIECVPYFADSVGKGYIRLEDLFILTLNSSIKKHGFIGENPVALFQSPPVGLSFEQDVHESLEHYINRLDRSYNDQVKGEAYRFTLLKEILNKPFDAMRNMLQYYRHVHGMDTDFNDSKPAMLEQYGEYFKGHRGLVRTIKRIYSVMLSYVDFVESSMKKYMRLDGYMAKLDEIEALFRPARHFIRENSKLIVEK